MNSLSKRLNIIHKCFNGTHSLESLESSGRVCHTYIKNDDQADEKGKYKYSYNKYCRTDEQQSLKDSKQMKSFIRNFRLRECR